MADGGTRIASCGRNEGDGSMIPVTYRHESECRIYNDGERWFYGATWMPIDMEYVINVTRNGLEMMANEKGEDDNQPDNAGYYTNARRFYREAVEAELRDAA